MAEALSRERIAELRASRNPLTWAELMALLEVYEASRPRPELPSVLLAVSGAVGRAAGTYGYAAWAIYAEAETPDGVRGTVLVGDRGVVANVTVHRRDEPLWDEAQAVLAAILWSALRALPPSTERDDG